MEYSQNMIKSTPPPVMNFVDYREYLKAWYAFQKEQNPHFSYAVWATKAGFKSRSFMRLVMLGKRTLGVDSIPLVLKSLGLRGDEAQYFTHLVHYVHSSNFESRDHYFSEILKLSKGTNSLVKDSYRFLSHPHTARVHLLISLKNFNGSLDSIAESLPLSLTEIKEILDTLEALGLAYYDQQQQTWKGVVKHIKLPEELGNLALQAFHSQSLKEAQKAISMNPAVRHYGSLLLFLDSNQYGEIKKELDQFLEYLSRKYQTASELPSTQMHQINLNLLPASKEIIRSCTYNARSESKDLHQLADQNDLIKEIEI